MLVCAIRCGAAEQQQEDEVRKPVESESVGPITLKGRHDEARTKMQTAVAKGRKEIEMVEVTQMLRKFGLSPQDIFLDVSVSVSCGHKPFWFWGELQEAAKDY